MSGLFFFIMTMRSHTVVAKCMVVKHVL